jgi:sarcosine oxidase subunit beta
MRTDVAIIGGGIVGCAAAYYLARRGRRVVLLERAAGVGLEASGRTAGGVRQHGRKAALPLAMEAVRLWATLTRELESDLEYVRTGNLLVALDDAEARRLEHDAAWEQAHGLSDVGLLTPAECRRLVPGLTERVIMGKYCASDGAANPMRVTPAFARAAQRFGARIETGTTVTAVLQRGRMVCGVLTDRGEIEAEHVLNAAGPWAAEFNRAAGCPTPIQPGRSQLLISERLPRRLGPWLSIAGTGYLRQAVAGNLVIGIGGQPNPEFSVHVDYPSLQRQAASMCAVLPWLREVALIRAFAGITEYTPDGEPYIGAVPAAPGLLVAAGFHGQGFCVGPMAGKVIADLLDGRDSPVSLRPFRPDRFALMTAEDERHAVRYPAHAAQDEQH